MAFIKMRRKIESSPEKPIFIISASRSGSTFLRKVMVSSGKINIPPESGGIIPRALNKYVEAMDGQKRQAVVEAFSKSQESKFWAINNSYLDQIRQNSLDVPFGTLMAEFYKAYAHQYMFEGEQWGDKTPYLAYFIPELNLIYPRARFIHILRDPVDVVNSRMTHFNDSLHSALNRWKTAVRSIKKAKNVELLEVRYDHLQSNGHKIFNQIFRFAGIGNFQADFLTKTMHLGDTHLQHHAMVETNERNTTMIMNQRQIDEVRKATIKLYHPA